MKAAVKGGFLVISIAFAVFLLFFTHDIDRTYALTSVNGTNTRLTIWDETDSSYRQSGDIAFFYANFTDKTTSDSINGSGIYCEIKFNYSESFTSEMNMSFNATSSVYHYNSSFDYKGNHTYNISCYGSAGGYEDLEASENFVITNTKPSIADILPTIHCYEDDDDFCIYNFSSNVTDPDVNDVITYSIDEETIFGNLEIVNETGIATINCTTDNCAISNCTIGNCDGTFYPLFLATDSDGRGENAEIEYCMYAVNDAPVFVPAISDMTVLQSDVFYLDIDATDEEGNTPLTYNMSIMSCVRPYTSNTSCDIFSINTTTGIIDRGRNFTNDEVGNYTVNFTVSDSGNMVEPYNATNYVVVNITVVNVNDPPNITTNLTEQILVQNGSLYIEINATDPENNSAAFSAITLYRNLTEYVNSTLFEFNHTNLTMYDNISVGVMNYSVLENHHVGNYTVNITADDGNINGTTWRLVNFTIHNINDAPVMENLTNQTAVQDINFFLRINAEDVDDFPSYVPYNDTVNGTLTFNLTFLQGNPFFDIENDTGIINFTANLSETGNYSLNITVTDGGGLLDYQVINLSVVQNNAPYISTTIPSQTTTQNQTFYIEFNGSDIDNSTQNITLYTETYYRNMALLSTTKFPVTNITNSSWPSLPVTGVMNYTNVTNAQVGNYTVRIIVMDTWNVTNHTDVNFTVYNINDNPLMESFSSQQNSTEDENFYMQINVTDIDSETPYGENITFNLTFLNGTGFFDINATTGIINFTVTNNSYEGNYTINLSAWDSYNITTWQIFNLTHRAINDYPVFTDLNSTIEARAYTSFTYDINATDEETNTSFFYNITFVNGTQFFNISNSTGIMNFTANSSHIGTYIVNISVTDAGYNSTFQGFLTNSTNTTQVILNVRAENLPPSITSWWLFPYQNVSNVTLEENESITIYASMTDINNDDLTCYWYVDSIENGDENEIDSGICAIGNPGASASYVPTFQDSGNRTVRFVVSDGNGTDEFSFNISVSNKNRAPELRYLVGNQKWPMNTNNDNINLSYHFYDPDNENSVTNDDNNMTYSLNVTPTYVTVAINQTSGQVILTPDNDWYGNDTVKFVANDSEYTTNSTDVVLNVTYVETQTETVTVSSSSGGGSSTTTVTVTVKETEIASLTIEAEPMIEVKAFEEIRTPLKFINSGEVDLEMITLSSEDIDDTGEIELQLKNKKIDDLAVDSEYHTELLIKTNNLTKQKYQIRITGKVDNPDFEQSTTIYLRTVPINKTTIDEQIRFVRDLFQENPACMDLMELIVSAERELGKGNTKKALNLTQIALENCRDLIRYTANMTYSRPAFITANRMPGSIVIVSIVLAVAVVIIASANFIMNDRKKKKAKEEFLKRRKEERKKERFKGY